jgi:hypothetical protein
MIDRYINGGREANEILFLITRLSAFSACLTRRDWFSRFSPPSLAGLNINLMVLSISEAAARALMQAAAWLQHNA